MNSDFFYPEWLLWSQEVLIDRGKKELMISPSSARCMQRNSLTIFLLQELMMVSLIVGFMTPLIGILSIMI